MGRKQPNSDRFILQYIKPPTSSPLLLQIFPLIAHQTSQDATAKLLHTGSLVARAEH